MLKVAVFNGPPRSGKGVAASHMKKLINTVDTNLPAFHMEFKDELFKICANTLSISVEDYQTDYDRQTPDKVWWMKDLVSISTSASMVSPREQNNFSQRDFLIHMSENVIKPSFGKDAFGKAFVNSLPEEGIVFVSDSGFPEELQPVIDHVGAENVLVIRIQRNGCSFEGDSRDYLTPEMFNDKVQFYQITNNGTEMEFLEGVEELVGMWLNAEN
ncbi:hypothetical protein [Vibrio phage vB_VibM_10AMN]|uniref:Deoxynucleotide monophosphate kinase n=1 Tax=Staphylococcus phage vB_VibM_10AMN12 TaxID=3076785 RepID=A0AA96R3V9_9CAUD|nr:hypothetical protein [Vibrio phage vB_VibM_10AMN]WNO47531.1 hypothetical protein [Staphylococcus phage vB_VibM_10AMN12]